MAEDTAPGETLRALLDRMRPVAPSGSAGEAANLALLLERLDHGDRLVSAARLDPPPGEWTGPTLLLCLEGPRGSVYLPLALTLEAIRALDERALDAPCRGPLSAPSPAAPPAPPDRGRELHQLFERGARLAPESRAALLLDWATERLDACAARSSPSPPARRGRPSPSGCAEPRRRR